ncbi:hypothetical protein PUN28_012313 [Cardiocondyla obscurior]|uniref:Uncharacterized protein n=1 Tax=Cardiocondyla obscurior TaxID=286306 RepID=A0AAW2FEJ8_9HYME
MAFKRLTKNIYKFLIEFTRNFISALELVLTRLFTNMHFSVHNYAEVMQGNMARWLNNEEIEKRINKILIKEKKIANVRQESMEKKKKRCLILMLGIYKKPSVYSHRKSSVIIIFCKRL